MNSIRRFAVLAATLAAAAAPTLAASRPRVAVLEVRALGIAAEKALLLSEVALTEASSVAGIEVIGRSDIAAMIGFEKEKAMLGCADDSQCMAEVAGAMGVDWILVGSVGQLDALFRLDLKLIDARRGKIAGRIGESIEGSQARLVAAIQSSVHALLDPIGAGGAPAPTAATSPPPAIAPSPGPAAAAPEAAPAPSSAEPASGLPRFRVGLRLGITGAGGSVAGDWPRGGMSSVVGGLIGFGLDATVRVKGGLSLGVYVDNAGARAGDAAPVATRSGAVNQIGLQLLWTQTSDRPRRWWASVGAGWEELATKGDANVDFSGYELPRLKAGLDFTLGRRFTVGPWAGLSVGRFTESRGGIVSFPDGDTYSAGPIGEKATHVWIGVGASGSYSL